MAESIVDFNMSDGLAPLIMQKLNANFRNLKDLIHDPEVVITSGATAPSPRTDETLWYNTETGDMYIWAEGVNMTTGRPNGEWGWKKLELNIVSMGQGQPVPATASDGQMFYYDYEHHLLYVYTGMGYWEASSPEDIYHQTYAPQWWTLQDFIEEVVYQSFLRTDGELNDEFASAVLAVVS